MRRRCSGSGGAEEVWGCGGPLLHRPSQRAAHGRRRHQPRVDRVVRVGLPYALAAARRDRPDLRCREHVRMLLRRQLGRVHVRLVDRSALERGRKCLEQREDLCALGAVALQRDLGLGTVCIRSFGGGTVSADERHVRRVQRWAERLGLHHGHPPLDSEGSCGVVDSQESAPLLDCQRSIVRQAQALALHLCVEAVEV